MKVLVVDDDAMQRMLLVDLLQRFERVEIIEAADGNAAWEAIEKGLFPVLCCCDMRMPGMSGMELLQRFKARHALATVPFVFITASTDRQTIEQAIASGVTSYMLKPFNLNKARSSLEKIFRGIRDRYCEQPSATKKRLHVSLEQLLGYFEALKDQLAAARPLVREQLASGDVAGARTKLESLNTACVAMGCWHAAAMIEHVPAMEAGLVDQVLKDVETIIDTHVLLTKTEFGISALRKPVIGETPAVETEPVANAA